MVEIYSEYINNFSRAMELVRLEAKRRSAFADFLNKKRLESSDRLNLFGLMVKPIQRWASSLFSVIFSFSVLSHQRGWASFYFLFRVRHIYSLSSRVGSFFSPPSGTGISFRSLRSPIMPPEVGISFNSFNRLNLFGLMVKPIQRWASSHFSLL